MKHQQNYSLLKHNTFGFSVQCSDFYVYDKKEDLIQLYNEGVFSQKWLPIGGGSNLLILNDLEYNVVQSNIQQIEVIEGGEKNCLVYVGSGVIWDDFVQWSISKNLGGIENLSFIPGMVGASPVQNIGAYGVEAKDVIRRVEVYDTKQNKFYYVEAADCLFEYRGSVFKRDKHLIVVGVIYQLTKEPYYELKLDYGNVREMLKDLSTITLKDVRDVIVNIRKSKLPLPSEIGSAGSFFKNPVISKSEFETLRTTYPDIPFYEVSDGYKIPAAWLISQCGWKGKNIGAAGVYEKQPLILVNRGGAKGEDVLFLMKQIQMSVKCQFSILLNPEACLIQ